MLTAVFYDTYKEQLQVATKQILKTHLKLMREGVHVLRKGKRNPNEKDKYVRSISKVLCAELLREMNHKR
jgi:hypothetical protein